MDMTRSARQFGVLVILLAALFRVFEMGLPWRYLQRQPKKTVPIELQTGRTVRSVSVLRLKPFIAESVPPVDAAPEVALPRFSAEEEVRVVNTASVRPDYAALLSAPLNLELTGKAPTLLIVHTHTSESYTKSGEDYPETAAYRTLDNDHNMVAIGDAVAQHLAEGGIPVLHDRECHDYPSYTGAYNHVRKAIQSTMAENPSIQLLLDLHRDAAESGGRQLRTAVETAGGDTAQVMFVLGCGNASLNNPNWQRSLSIALKLQSILEAQVPGITRPISLRPQRFNQDLASGALLIEIGTAGNTQEEALRAARHLADALLTLKHGSF